MYLISSIVKKSKKQTMNAALLLRVDLPVSAGTAVGCSGELSSSMLISRLMKNTKAASIQSPEEMLSYRKVKL